jgi:nicotinamidase/pyrazinamidase
LRAGLDTRGIDVVIDKGQDPETDGYSGFDGTELGRILREREVERVHIGGLALDYCVKNTALDAVKAGFPATVHLNATRAVNREKGDDESALKELRAAGVEVVED